MTIWNTKMFYNCEIKIKYSGYIVMKVKHNSDSRELYNQIL